MDLILLELQIWRLAFVTSKVLNPKIIASKGFFVEGRFLVTQLKRALFVILLLASRKYYDIFGLHIKRCISRVRRSGTSRKLRDVLQTLGSETNVADEEVAGGCSSGE
jgi:hypothetical protein